MNTPDLEKLLDAGVACHVAGELEEALFCYGTALEMDPGNVLALYNIALVFEEVGDLATAAEAFEWAAKCSAERDCYDPDILAAARSYKGGVN
jgi:Flp pilus assembly protein TadD